MNKEELLKFMQDVGVNKYSYGPRLKYIREKKNMTQKELGLACGFGPDTADVRIRQYECGDKYPRADIRSKIDDALGIKANLLQDFNCIEGNGISNDAVSFFKWLYLYDVLDFSNSEDADVTIKDDGFKLSISYMIEKKREFEDEEAFRRWMMFEED